MPPARKSNQRSRKQARREQLRRIKPAREMRIKALLAHRLIREPEEIPCDAIPAAVGLHAGYSAFVYLPKLFYKDEPFTCKDCGKPQVWTALQQLWWYEQQRGDIHSKAGRCRACRKKLREHRAASLAGLERKRQRTAEKKAAKRS